MKFQFKSLVHFFLVIDSFDVHQLFIVNETWDNIFCSSLRNKEGEVIYFDDEAYHLKEWASKNDLEFYYRTNIIKISFYDRYFKPGTKVTYSKINKIEKGVVKRVNGNRIYVVFNCSGNWDKYLDYTACLVNPDNLTLGWDS